MGWNPAKDLQHLYDNTVKKGPDVINDIFGTGKTTITSLTDPAIQPQAPQRASVNDLFLQDERLGYQRQRASQTLFTGAQGVLDSPKTASSVLLGY